MAVNPRVSEMQRYDSTMDRINNARGTLNEINETAASLKKLRKLSTDPVGSVKVLRNRRRLENVEQFRKTIDFGKGFLSKTEDGLRSIAEAIMRVKELSIQQANGTYDETSHKAVAEEIRQLIDHVIILGNTTYGDKHVFGGFRNGSPPLADDGSYMGDDGRIYVQVDESSFTPINVSGREIFDAPENPHQENGRPPLVQLLRNVYLSLKDWDPQLLHASMDHLDEALNSILSVASSLGAKTVALNDAADRLDRGEIQLQNDNNHWEGADEVKSALDLKRAETSLNYTLNASSRMLTPSLLEFLK